MSPDTEVFVVSTFAEIGLNALLPYLEKDNTIILIGSSGVGKSTLINKLAGKEVMDVSGIREKDGKGRHTTTHRQMIQMPQGSTMIDTPGMREIGLLDVEEGMDDTFSDIKELIRECKYSDCKHQSEPGCKVKEAIEAGILDEERFRVYMGFKKENKWTIKLAKLNSKKR